MVSVVFRFDIFVIFSFNTIYFKHIFHHIFEKQLLFLLTSVNILSSDDLKQSVPEDSFKSKNFQTNFNVYLRSVKRLIVLLNINLHLL